jgi:hypothetical protein
MLQIPIGVSDASVLDTGPRTAESVVFPLHRPTEAVSIIQAAPQLLGQDQEESVTEHPSNSGKDYLAEDLIEVKDSHDYEDSSVQIAFLLKGSLKRTIQFW